MTFPAFAFCKNRHCLLAWLADLAYTLTTAALIASVLGIAFLNSDNWPTGGDAASHLLYAKLYADDLLFKGQILPWVPEVFGGMPFLSYYFPLPFIVIALLSKLIGLASAFKWGGFMAAMLLPGAVFMASRRWLGFSWQAGFFGGLGALAFVLHEQNSIWGGNLLSTLAGEFAYSYGLLFAVLAMMAWARAINLGRGWLLAAMMEAASGFSHGFPLLVVGFSSAFLLLDAAASGNIKRARTSFMLLFKGHALAFAMLGGWLWPMLEMHSLTIPNDASFPLSGWRDLLPGTLWPILGGGVLGLIMLAFPSVRRGWDDAQRRATCYFASAAGLAAVFFIAGDQLGLADIRFFPLTWLLGGIACGWLAGQALASFGRLAACYFISAAVLAPLAWYARDWLDLADMSHYPKWLLAWLAASAACGWLAQRALTSFAGFTTTDKHNDSVTLQLARVLLLAAAGIGLLGWIAPHVQRAPDWGLWNHSGLDPKPQWQNLNKLFPAMEGTLWSPRMSFEHDPANNDLGSTRTLEALPMFIKHRPVLEGLYMESALLGPAAYLVQSEISLQPSSPLVRFPSASLDPEFAARHLNFLHADTILLRSKEAKGAIEASGQFVKIAESAPFALYRVKRFDSRLAQVVTQPIRIRPMHDWMQDAFGWFRTRSRFDAYLPVYGKDDKPLQPAKSATLVREKKLERDELVFETDAIGAPHMIKIAYHPRWQLASKGSMRIAGPGFLLVVPEEQEIRLVYGHTMIGKIGMTATCIAILIALFVAWHNRTHPSSPSFTDSALRWRWLAVAAGWLLLLAAGLYFASRAPEGVYKEGWELMNTQKYKEAGEKFKRAFELRKPPAKKEEALFWMSKSSELAGMRAEAKAGYRELVEHYHGFWIPESLYTYALLARQDGETAQADAYLQRLREEYPTSQWALKKD